LKRFECMKKKDVHKKVSLKREEELEKQLARSLADYDNLRKRAEKEKEEIIKLANIGFFLRLSPVIDNLKKAQEHLKDEGLDNIINELIRIISEEDIINVEAEAGVPFDENYHEAIEVERIEDDNKEGLISQVLLEGWRLKDGPVIRPAKVIVYKKKS
jgi:molecular chaperone GrpE